MTNGIIKNSSADLKPPRSPPDDDENDHANVEVQANETSIMNLLLAAAAKSQKQPNGMAKAVCTKLQKTTMYDFHDSTDIFFNPSFCTQKAP